jgi:inner membrane protease ATP23
MACTEIRAENLSGECGWFKELTNRQVQQFAKHGQACVKRRAALSLKANPNCRDRAEEYIDAAFERCFEDTFPFDRHPNLR